MLTGKVSDPYEGDGFVQKDATPEPVFEKSDAELPF